MIGPTRYIVVPLTKGLQAIIDEDDEERICSGRKWVASWNGRKFYAVRGKGKTREYMHRAIIGAEKGVEVDHINGISLDNRRSNLRRANRSQNAANYGARSLCGFRGVTYHKRIKKWSARISPNGDSIHLGVFATPEIAAAAYNSAALEHYGEFARLNKV